MQLARFLGAGSLGLCLMAAGCGADTPEPVGDVSAAIQGGYVDSETSGVVGLGIFEQDHFFVGHCSGTLIAPNLVLTARHCVTQLSIAEDANEVECGVTDFRRTRAADSLVVSPLTERPDNPTDPSFVRGSSVHPAPGADDVCGYDVALVILERSFTEAEAVPIVPRIDRIPESNEAFSAQGFGLTADREDASSGLRMRIDDREVLCSPDDCYVEYPDIVRETEWVSANAGVCSGDSGGPALDADGKVIGVASRGGSDCMATVYGDVVAWADFIIEMGLRAAEQGGYPAPFWTSGSSEAPVETVPVVLDEPTDDEAEVPSDASDHGDVDCEPGRCDDPTEQTFAAESGCAVSHARERGTGAAGVLLALALVAGLGQRRRASVRPAIALQACRKILRTQHL